MSEQAQGPYGTVLDSILAVSQAITEAMGTDQIMQTALDEVLKLQGLDAGTVRILDEASQTLILRAYRGFPPEATRRLERIKLGEKYAGKSARTGEPFVVEDIRSTPWLVEISEARPDLTSLASIPLKSSKGISGTMNIYAARSDVFGEYMLGFLKAIGLQIGLAVENADLLEKVKRSFTRFESMVSSSPHGIISLDAEGRVLSYNDAAQRILELHDCDLGRTSYHELVGNRGDLMQVFESLEPNQEVTLFGRESGRKYLDVSRSHTEDETGKAVGSIITIEDVTEKKETDEYIQRISKLASLGELAAGVAHEVRNPLCGIAYVLDDLHDYFRSDPEQRERIEGIIKEVDRLDKIVTGLLDFAQVSPVSFSPHDVNAIVEDACVWIKKRCADQAVTISRNYADNLPRISVDPERLKQALLNLMINSLDAMQQGGTLTIRTNGSAGQVRDPSTESKFVEISIEDSGEGIPVQNQERMFNPFFTTKASGTGLGLSITQRIVMDHGGKISVASHEDEGTRFTIYLPTLRPGKGGILSVAIESEIDVLDPHKHGGWMTFRVVRNIFEGLVDRDLSRSDVAYCPIIPCLADSWEISPSGRVYTFHLRNGVKFHDGTVFDAEAVRFNVERMTNPRAPQYDPKAAHYSIFLWRYLKEVKVVNSRTVEIHLCEPFSDFVPILTEGGLGSATMLSPASWARYGNDGITDHPVGTGPFRFVERGKRGEVVLEKNHDYWGDTPFLDKLVFKPIPDPATRVAALQLGEVDLIFVPSPDAIEILEKAGFVVIQGPVPHVWFIYLNMRSDTMLDARVRKAINMAIDKERMANDLLKGRAKVARGLPAPGSPSYDEGFVGYEYNPEEAKKLLEEAGCGKGFTMTLQTSTAGSGQLIPIQMAEWIKHDLAKVGIECKLDLHEWVDYIQVWANGIPEGVDANQISWGMTSDYWLEIVAHSKNCAPNGRNSGYYRNVEVDKLLDKARVEQDEQKRIALYRRASILIGQDAAYVPIVNDLAPIVMNRRVKGVSHAPAEWCDFARAWVKE